MYKVLKDFVDLKDDNHLYRKGEDYPRKGVKVSKERLLELSTTANRCGIVLIKEDEAAKETKPKKGRKKKE